jgi:hypothetical protein
MAARATTIRTQIVSVANAPANAGWLIESKNFCTGGIV